MQKVARILQSVNNSPPHVIQSQQFYNGHQASNVWSQRSFQRCAQPLLSNLKSEISLAETELKTGHCRDYNLSYFLLSSGHLGNGWTVLNVSSTWVNFTDVRSCMSSHLFLYFCVWEKKYIYICTRVYIFIHAQERCTNIFTNIVHAYLHTHKLIKCC